MIITLLALMSGGLIGAHVWDLYQDAKAVAVRTRTGRF
jgi:hypothetical protein